MKKRILIALLTAGMILQSFTLPVLAVSEDTASPTPVATVLPEKNEEGSEETETDEYTPKPTPTGTMAETSEEASEEASVETPSSLPEEAAAEATAGATAEATAGAEDKTPAATQEEADPSSSPEDIALPSMTPEARVQEELETAYISGGEGVYQEGSFTVLGEPEKAASEIELVGTDDSTAAAECLYQGMLAKQEYIDTSSYNIDVSAVASFVYGVINDHPDLYYVRTAFRYSYSGTKIMGIYPVYISGLDEAAFEAGLAAAMSTIDDTMSDLEKAITLHDYIVLNCEYDYDNYQNSSIPMESYTAYGVLAKNIAVCQGYALAYKLLLNKAGIDCYMVSSSSMNHAWNLIRLDGQFYQVDATWDDPFRDALGLVQHNYMFVSDDNFASHYDWTVTTGSSEVDFSATDTRYDDAFWRESNSPLVIAEGGCYYINDRTIYKIDLETNVQENILNGSLGYWRTANGYYTSTYSGLFKIENDLYYNTCDQILRIPLSGGTPIAVTDVLSDNGSYVYGSVLSQGTILYSLNTAYPYSAKGEIYTAVLTEPIQASVSRVTLNQNEVRLHEGESTSLSVTILPTYAQWDSIAWKSSDVTVATVSETGVVTAVKGGGSCTITVTVDDKSAECNVTVIGKLEAPVFSPAEGTIDKGSSITLTADGEAVIYYTVDGSEPVISNTKTTKQYTAPIVIESDMTVTAFAASSSENFENSDIVSASYQVCTNNLRLSDETLTLTEGDTRVVTVTELPTTKTAEDIVWKSSNSSVATVDENGLITAVYEGAASITASVTDHQGREVVAECRITVEPAVYQVTFIGWNDKVIKTEEVMARRDAVFPDITVPAGYTFTGWSSDGKAICQDTIIKAQYEVITYTITYQLNGGTGAGENPSYYTVESESITLQSAEKEGFTFTGWYMDETLSGNRISMIEKGSTGDITLYAGWKDARGLWLKVEGADEDNVIPVQEYTGKAVKPAATVYYGDQPLTAGTDYTISYKNNTAANLLETAAEQKKAPTITIKGKGNYSGTLTKTFVIARKNIEDEDVQIDDLAASYNKGKAVHPAPTVKWNGKKLTNKKDFTVEYPDSGETAYREPGTYTVRISGRGNYTGTREITLTVTDPASEILLSKVKIAGIPNQTYSGEEVALTQDMPKLTYGKEPLILGEDYEVTYADGDDGTAIGVHEIVITGKGTYKGVRRVTFKITGTSISTAKISKLPALTYTGSAVELNPNAAGDAVNKLTITSKTGEVLEEGVDYTLSFSNNVNVGTAKMTITGIGRYTGTVNKTFKIKAYSLKEGSEDIQARFANASQEQTYDMGGAKPKVKVTFRGVELVEGVDYTLSYQNNTSVTPKAGKTPTVTIKGKKNFTGSRSLTFTIVQKDISEVAITAGDMEENTKAGKYMSTPTLTDSNGKKLKAGTDYEKTYVYQDENGTILSKTDRPQAGSTLTVIVTGKGNFKGETSTTFRIFEKGMNLSKAKVKINTKFYYTGENITLSKDDLTVTMGKVTLSADDYEIVGYSNNLKKGTAKVTLKGKGKYGGTKQVSFKILSQIMQWWEKALG